MLLLTLCQPYFTVTLQFLPGEAAFSAKWNLQINNPSFLYVFSDYVPSDKEQGDPELYAKNMAQMMAKELGISVSKLTLKQWDEKRKADREAKALKPWHFKCMDGHLLPRHF